MEGFFLLFFLVISCFYLFTRLFDIEGTPPKVTSEDRRRKCEEINEEFEQKIKDLNFKWDRRPFWPGTCSYVPMQGHVDDWYESLCSEIDEKYNNDGNLSSEWYEEMRKLGDDRALLSTIVHEYDDIADHWDRSY